MRASIFCSMCLSLLFLQGCASIFCGDSRTVEIKSEPSDAKFTIKDRHGIAVHKGTTPATVTLKRGGGYFRAADYTILLEKEGYQPDLSPIKSDIEWGWYLPGNAIFGGLIGIVIVDPITGGMYKPGDVNVAMSLASADAATGKKITGYRVKDENGKTYRTAVYEDGTEGTPEPFF